ncbi:MAG TPA: ABC transporter ATP-binding protein [Sulfolobales archaeon]|nr:ABC transporter ATP-binding protein [Sulfolobales archaeon]
MKLVETEDLRVYFRVRSSFTKKVRAVDGVSLYVEEGETLGVVGESGSGKSTLGKAILGLVKPTHGRILYMGKDIWRMRGSEYREFRRNAQMVFQDPHTSLNPRMTIIEILEEPLKAFKIDVGDTVKFLSDRLAEVGLGAEFLYRYPHELSGGQKQRVAILRAIVSKPRFVVLDEPTSSLDVSVQAQILELLKDLQKKHNLTYLFISHDLSVVKYMSNRIAVMYLGKVFEISESDKVFERPLHPYTQMLVSSIPIPDPKVSRDKKRVRPIGEPPSPINPPKGCRFHPRCPLAMDICRREEPPSIEDERNHFVSCWLYMKK